MSTSTFDASLRDIVNADRTPISAAIARCDREIEAIESANCDPETKAFLPTMGQNDWAVEKQLIQESARRICFERLRDYSLIYQILTSPTVYGAIGDDYVPADPVFFEVNRHPDIWYVAVYDARGPFGMFTLMPQSRVCWEVHAVMLPRATVRMKWAAARELSGWLATHTECKRLTAAVPANNWPAVIYGTHGIGMRYVGRHDKAFMKGGKLQDLILLGLQIGS